MVKLSRNNNNYIMEWDKLSMADRAKYIALGVKSGITSLDNIREVYNRYDNGGKKYQVKNTKGELLGEFNSVEERDNFINNNDNLSWVEPDLKELVVTAKSPNSSNKEEMSDQEIARYLRNLDRTGSFDYANKVHKADRHASQYNAENMLGALTSGLNVLSPSTQVGATIDWLQGEKGYWEGIATNQSGFFTDKFTKEHPYWALAGNLAGDAALGLMGIDTLELASIGPSKLKDGVEFGRKVYNSLGHHPLQRWDMLTVGEDLYKRGIISKEDLKAIPTIKIRSTEPGQVSSYYNGIMRLPSNYRAKYNRGFDIGHELGHFTETYDNIMEFVNSPNFSRKYIYGDGNGEHIIDGISLPDNWIEQRADWIGSRNGELTQKQALGYKLEDELSASDKRIMDNPHLFKSDK